MNKNAIAWIVMVSSLALHVADEAIHNFLSLYNVTVIGMKDELGISMPTFEFKSWLTGLVIAIIIGYGITPIVRRGGKPIRIITTVLGFTMILNGLGHIAGSIYLGWLIPGFWSSPILLSAAGYIVYRGFNGEW